MNHMAYFKNTELQVQDLEQASVCVQCMSNSLTAATCMQSLGSAEHLQVLPPRSPGC